MIIAPSMAEKQEAREHRRARRRPYITALLAITAVLALYASVWTALHLTGPLWTGGLAGLAVVAAFWAGGRLIGKVDDEL
jgi:hypothetical protein